jgi:hypothetical protein
LAMMPRGLLVVLRGGGVVLCARKDVGHGTSCVVLFPIPGLKLNASHCWHRELPGDARPTNAPKKGGTGKSLLALPFRKARRWSWAHP